MGDQKARDAAGLRRGRAAGEWSRHGAAGSVLVNPLLALQAAAGNAAVSHALSGRPTVQRDPDGPVTPAHAGGLMGERDAAFGLGEKGFEIVIGPTGTGGHKLTGDGFDIVAYHPETGELWIVDNKASGGTTTVQKVSALTDNLAAGTTKAIAQIEKLPDFPHKKAVLAQLEATRSALKAGRKLPVKVSLVVTNAGGYHSGVSKKLKGLGITFEDLTGKPVRDARKVDVKRARQAGASPGRPTTLTSAEDAVPSTTRGAAPAAPAEAPRPASGRATATTAEAAETAKAAKLRARSAASSLASESKVLRGARWLGRVTAVLGAVGSFMDFFHFTGMATRKLAGGAFIHEGLLNRARGMEAEAGQLRGEYERTSEAVYELNDSFWRASGEQWAATQAALSIVLLRSDVSGVRDDAQRRRQRIDRMLKEVEGRLAYANKILESPATFGAIGMGSGILAEVFAASQDLEQIAGSLRSASESLAKFIQKLDEDLDYLTSWLDVMVAVSLGAPSPR